MVHRKNRDLKAELVEMQLAAQTWEEKFNEAQATIALKQQAAEHFSREATQLERTVDELRADLGQASRELIAVTNTLDQCRRERGAALDELHRVLKLALAWRAQGARSKWSTEPSLALWDALEGYAAMWTPIAIEVLNPEAIGNPELTPIVQLSPELADMLVESGQCQQALGEQEPAP
jgi:hypothetical protein